MGQGDAPPPLSLAWECEHWRALPVAGGLYAQPYTVMRQMTAALNVYRAHAAYREALTGGNTAAWADANPDAWALVCEMESERSANG